MKRKGFIITLMAILVVMFAGFSYGGGWKVISGSFTNGVHTFTYTDMNARGVSAIDLSGIITTNLKVTLSNITGITNELLNTTNTLASYENGELDRCIKKNGTIRITGGISGKGVTTNTYVIYLKD